MLADILGANPLAPTQIASLSVDIVRSAEYQYDQSVTSHPVEAGYDIHDNIINQPMKVTMTVGISSHPVTWFYVNGIGKSKFANGLAALEAIRDAKQPITIVRPDKILTDMVMTSCRYSKTDESRSIIWVDLSFTHIKKVTVQTAEIPENIVDESAKESVGETAADGGSATQVNVDSGTGNVSDTVNSDSNKSAQGVDGIKSALGL